MRGALAAEMYMHVRVTRLGMKKQVFTCTLTHNHRETFACCLHEHYFVLTTLKRDNLRSCSLKNQGVSRTKNQFQVLSRP